MPIYAYKCSTCQHEQDVLQKMSDAPLTVCPECGAATFTKQLTAAGFQLKGSGWYATDFKNGPPKADAKSTAKPGDAAGAAAASKDAAAPADPAPAKDAGSAKDAAAPVAPAGKPGGSGSPPAAA
jgi:putative FmdB family regulatory protein